MTAQQAIRCAYDTDRANQENFGSFQYTPATVMEGAALWPWGGKIAVSVIVWLATKGALDQSGEHSQMFNNVFHNTHHPPPRVLGIARQLFGHLDPEFTRAADHCWLRHLIMCTATNNPLRAAANQLSDLLCTAAPAGRGEFTPCTLCDRSSPLSQTGHVHLAVVRAGHQALQATVNAEETPVAQARVRAEFNAFVVHLPPTANAALEAAATVFQDAEDPTTDETYELAVAAAEIVLIAAFAATSQEQRDAIIAAVQNARAAAAAQVQVQAQAQAQAHAAAQMKQT
jgi:hypothetical protein